MSRTMLPILIVDDNQMMTKTLKDILMIKGYEADIAFSASEALAKLDVGSFACVLSDIKMPGVNGVELYQEIKAKAPNLPVILMTAYATDSLIEEGLKAGVIAVLTKPLNLDLFLDFLPALKKKLPIVVIEPDPNVRHTLTDWLTKHDFTVTPLTRWQALSQMPANEQHIVLLGAKLDQANDLDVLQKIRQTYALWPIVLMTDDEEATTSILEIVAQQRAYSCFYKPLQLDALLQILTKIHHQELSRMLNRSLRLRR